MIGLVKVQMVMIVFPATSHFSLLVVFGDFLMVKRSLIS